MGGWMYFPHSAAVSIALALAATQSPLVHDAYLLYQLSSNKLMILYAVSTVVHFLSWIVLWLALTFTGTWNFKINAVMFQPIEGFSSVGLSAEILIDRKTDAPVNPFSSSLLVLCEGRDFPVQDSNDRRSVLSVIPAKQQAQQVTSPLPSCMSSKAGAAPAVEGWTKEHKGIKYMAVRKEVTFDDELQSPRYYSPCPSDKSGWKSPTPTHCCPGNVESDRDFDAGEYAYLSGGRGSRMKNFLADNHEAKCRQQQQQESIYSGNPHPVCSTSPVPTIDSSSGVSSAGSQRSNMVPPSSTPSCIQYSEGSYSDKRSVMIVEPTAHYEPAPPTRGLARRSSMRVSLCSPSYETKAQLSKEYPMLGKCNPQQTMLDNGGIYGKLRWDNSPGGGVMSSKSPSSSSGMKSSPNYEAIYGKTRRVVNQANGHGEMVMMRSPLVDEMNEQMSHKEIIVENLRRPPTSQGHVGNAGDSMSDICPPIPPPLPSSVLTYVSSRHNNNSNSICGLTRNSNNGGGGGGILMAANSPDSDL